MGIVADDICRDAGGLRCPYVILSLDGKPSRSVERRRHFEGLEFWRDLLSDALAELEANDGGTITCRRCGAVRANRGCWDL